MPDKERGRELDAAIHQDVIGRPVLWVYGQLYDAESGLQVDRYSSDANAARLVLAEIERRGKKSRFMRQLDDLIDGERATGEAWKFRWHYLTATPEAICLAALAAVRGGKG